jgi:site-specific DNA recombinase
MRVGVYVRVSTQRQAEAQTIEQQLERLLAHAAEQGWTVESEDIFRDDGYSGATLKRPGLERLRDRAGGRFLDLLLLTAPDRLARHYVHQVLLLEEIQASGCRVHFLERPMSEDPHDQLLLQIRGAVAEYERTLIAERMRRGRLAKLKAGLLLPWTRAPYGYRLDPDRPRDPAGVRVDEAEAAAVREMFRWYADEASSLYRLAKKLHQDGVLAPRGHWRWNVATLRGILSNPCYTGQVWAGRVWRRGVSAEARAPAGSQAKSHHVVPREEWIPVAPIPAIVSQELFDRVEAKLARNRQFASRNNTAHPYLVRNLVRCGLCGLSCQGACRKGYRYYICRGKQPPSQSCRDEKCPSRFTPAGTLDELVWTDLCALVTEPAEITRALERAHGGHWVPEELQARRDSLRRGIASLDQQLERLTDAYLGGVVGLEEYRRRRTDLEQRREAFGAQLKQLQSEAESQLQLAELVTSAEALCERIRAGLEHAGIEEKRRIVELLVDSVVVQDGDVEIRYVVPLTRAAERDRSCQLRSVHLDLPAQPVQLRNRESPEREVVRQKVELLSGFRVAIGDATQMNGVFLRRSGAGEPDGLIADQTGRAVHRSGVDSLPFDPSLGARHEDRMCVVQAVEPRKVDERPVEQIDRSRLRDEGIQDPHVAELRFRNPGEGRDAASEVEKRMHLYPAFGGPEARPREN